MKKGGGEINLTCTQNQCRKKGRKQEKKKKTENTKYLHKELDKKHYILLSHTESARLSSVFG